MDIWNNSYGKVMFSCGDVEHVWFSQPNCARYDTMPGKKTIAETCCCDSVQISTGSGVEVPRIALLTVTACG